MNKKSYDALTDAYRSHTWQFIRRATKEQLENLLAEVKKKLDNFPAARTGELKK